MKKFKELLEDLDACGEAIEWVEDKTIEEVVEHCHRGDWLLWLAARIDIGLQPLTLAKGHCANTVRHLMKDERSIKAVDVAIAFGEGRATRKELDDAYDTADDAYDTAAAAAGYVADAAADYVAYDAAAYAASNAADAAAGYVAADYVAYDAAAYAAAAAAAAADYVAYAAAAARKENQMLTADVCREYIGNLIIDKVNKLLNTK